MNTKLIPLFSISGLTLISFGGLIFFKTKESSLPLSEIRDLKSEISPGPTQVPKSIEHYLLTSQQFFTQALDAQNQQKSPETVSNLLNRSLSFANESIKIFPNDFRAYVQRGQIYQSLTSPKSPDAGGLDPAISDYLTAQKLNPNSPEITRTLATLFAKKGDAQNTLAFLSKTVSLQPTTAQNFYDLARLQQQTGQINNAIITYDQLLSILTDPTQKSTIESEKQALEKLASQAPDVRADSYIRPSPEISPDQPLLQASIPNTGLIIAAPETSKDVFVNGTTDSNSLSGNAVLKTGQTQLKIDNSKINNSSMVYVSIISGGKNQTLEVKSKSSDSFTVGLLSPSTDDISFKWWIVN